MNAMFIVLIALVLHLSHDPFREIPRPDFATKGMPVPPLPHHWMFWGRHLIMLMFVAGLSTAIRVSIQWRHTEKRLVQAEQEKSEAELKNLKSQLNPHFLLNTLNNIYALVAISSGTSSQTIEFQCK